MKVYDGSQTDDDGDAGEPERLKVGIAEYEVSADGAELTTSGLGSCIGLAITDTNAAVSGLVHVMLPRADDMPEGNEAKFADTGTELLIEELTDLGGAPATMEAKIAGGSDMLDFSENGSGIGVRNVESVKETLEAYDIPLVAEDVGGDHGRSLRLEAASGDLVVKSANKENSVL
jgi:chemotaxis protein CheD